MNAIETDRLTKLYGARCVVHDVSLRVPVGCVFGLLGCNGAGKSTTIRMLTGMARPTSGTARLLGHDVATLAPEVRRRIAYIAENHPLYGWMTVGGAIDFARAAQLETWNDHLVEQVLDHFRLSRKAKVRRLSNGQRAQVSLTIAVAPDPELLILDDPTLGLDTVVRRDFLESLVAIIQRRGRTILFSSHILGDVERVADRVGIMVDGVLRVDCATDQFKTAVRQVTVAWPEQVPDGGSVRQTLASLPGVVGHDSLANQLNLVVIDWSEEHERRLSALAPARFDVQSLSLEDAFIGYTRGPRRPLPLFEEALS